MPCLTILGVKQLKVLALSHQQMGIVVREHTICGAVLTEDSVFRFRKVQVIINEKEESAIAAFWVSDGVDWCGVGFLP